MKRILVLTLFILFVASSCSPGRDPKEKAGSSEMLQNANVYSLNPLDFDDVLGYQVFAEILYSTEKDNTLKASSILVWIPKRIYDKMLVQKEMKFYRIYFIEGIEHVTKGNSGYSNMVYDYE